MPKRAALLAFALTACLLVAVATAAARASKDFRAMCARAAGTGASRSGRSRLPKGILALSH